MMERWLLSFLHDGLETGSLPTSSKNQRSDGLRMSRIFFSGRGGIYWVRNGNFRLLVEVSKVPERESFDRYSGHVQEMVILQSTWVRGPAKGELEICFSQHPVVCPRSVTSLFWDSLSKTGCWDIYRKPLKGLEVICIKYIVEGIFPVVLYIIE